jgi:muconolactone delta-isomerase
VWRVEDRHERLSKTIDLSRKGDMVMRCLVAVRFVQGQQEAKTALLPAEQAHVRELMGQGVIEAIYIAADRSHVWVVMQGESPDHVRTTMTSFPLYPYMELEVTPLLDVVPGRSAE